MNFDTERVICEIRERPALWDIRCESYKHKADKQNAWIDVTKELTEDYDLLGEGEKKKAVEKLIQRWKSARDQYVRSKTFDKNPKPSGKKIKKYVYADLMQFLDPIISAAGAQPLPQSPSVLRESSPSSEIRDLPQRPMKRGTERTSHSEDETVEYLQRERDEDVCFFRSMLPKVRRIPKEQKLHFQMEFLQLLLKYMPSDSTSISHNYVEVNTDLQYSPICTLRSRSTLGGSHDYVKSENFTSDNDDDDD